MFCVKCGAQNPDDAAFCKSCGAPMKVVPAVETIQPKRSAKKRHLLIGIGAAAVAVVFVVVLAITIFGGKSYKSVVEDFVEATFEADGKALISLYPDEVIEVLCENRDMTKREFTKRQTEGLEDFVKDLDHKYEDEDWSYSYEITEEEDYSKEKLKMAKAFYENPYDLTVKEGKIVTLEVTITTEGDDENSFSSRMLLVKIGNSWYVDPQTAPLHYAYKDAGY